MSKNFAGSFGCFHLIYEILFLFCFSQNYFVALQSVLNLQKNQNKMSVTLRKKDLKTSGKYSLYLDIYQETGKRKFEFLKLYLYKKPRNEEQKSYNRENQKLAESIRAKRELMINTSRNGFETAKHMNANFFDFAEIICEQKTGSTNRDYKTTIRHFKNFINSEKLPVGSITSELLEEFRNYLSKSGLKENTQFNYFAKLKTILKEAHHKKLIPTDPTSNVKNVKVNPVQKTFLTIDEIRTLSETTCKNDDVKRAFLFACNTGLRFGDLQRLTGNDISGNSLQFKQQKTDEVVYFPLNNNALNLLGTETKSDTPVFKLHKDIGYCNQILRTWAELAGIKKYLTFHVARHSFATNLLIFGTDISVVSKLLGHTTLKHTMIYAKIVDSLKSDAVHRLPDF